MKRLFFTIFTAIFLMPVYAQENNALTSREDSLQQELNIRNRQLEAERQAQKNQEIWKKGRYLHISYSFAQTALESSAVEKGKFGFALTKGTSYLFPKKPIANILKIGFDVNWTDISFAKYTESSTEWSNDIESEYSDYDEDDEMSGILGKITNLGRMSILVGMLGVGPNVTVAPFASFDNQARFLKASIYFHYQPTFGTYLVLDDGDMSASYSYCNMYQFGGKITWKAIGVGVEGHWGSGKFKSIGLDLGESEYGDFFENSSSSNKIKRKFANTRLYLFLRF